MVNKTLNFSTEGEIDFIDLSDGIRDSVLDSKVKNGFVHVFAPHATGVIILTENDPALLDDIKDFLRKIVPGNRSYNHPSNAHAHLRSMLFSPDKTIPVIDGHVAFGTWQSILFVETDVYPRQRTVIVQIMGE
ncbi:TPA: YjbQ family protein [Candidatus Bathyarchaeota archaeon]|nr:YjbQ family protein [Candidatus Bathyarchaeota archaeon]